MEVIISNAFSFNMVEIGRRANIEMMPVEASQVADLAGEKWTSAIGHADIAALASVSAAMDIPTNRKTVSLGSGTHRILIAQYQGPRLPEGAKQLPEGASMVWLAVKVVVY